MKRGITRAVAPAFAAVAMAFGGMGAAHADKQNIEFGWTAWSDAEFVTKLAKRLIEEHYDYEVTLTLADIGVQYQGVANGDLDAMLMAWLPDTHENYMDRVGDQVVQLGTLYEGAKLGWVVPDYVDEAALSSIEDLQRGSNRQRLGGQVQGIDPGAGLMQLSEKAMEEYGLDDYRLQSASGAAMTAALARAVRNNEWIVVTGWTPHWKFGRFELRFLDDPEGVLGDAQHIDVVARQGFEEDHPEVAGFLSRMHLPLDELQEAMAEAQDSSYDEAIENYIANNPERIQAWLEG